jgi:hypothetical protein
MSLLVKSALAIGTDEQAQRTYPALTPLFDRMTMALLPHIRKNMKPV